MLWWRIDSRLENRSIYLYSFILSPRQVILVFASLVLGYIVSTPVSFSIAGIPFLGRLIVVVGFVFVGYMASSIRIKMVPPEMVIFYRLTGYRSGKAGPKKTAKKPGMVETVPREGKVQVEKLPVDDFRSPTKYNISGKAKVAREAKIALLLDGRKLDEKTVGPALQYYHLTYKPKIEDIGTHELTVMLEGRTEPVLKRTLVVFPTGKEDMILELGKKGGG